MRSPDSDQRRGIYRRVYGNFVNGRRINAVSIEAEALFWRLTAVADDFGNLWGDSNLIKCHAAPRRSWTLEQVEAMVDELVNVCLVSRYEFEGEVYLSITGWEKTQPAPRNGKRVCKFPWNPGASSASKSPHSHSHSHSHSPLPPEGESASAKRVEKEKLPFLETDLHEIYAAYPRHVGVQAAVKAIGKALIRIHGRNGVDDCAAWLLARVQSYAKSPAGNAGQFTPLPATWFNQDRFDDDDREWQRRDANQADRPAAYRSGETDWEEVQRRKAIKT